MGPERPASCSGARPRRQGGRQPRRHPSYRSQADRRATAAAFSPDGLLDAAGDRFGGLFLWETRSGQDFLSLRGHAKPSRDRSGSGGDTLATAGEDGRVVIWDLHTGNVAREWDAHSAGVLGIDIHPSGRIASAGRDRRIKVWEPGGRLTADLGPTADQATRVAWMPGGHSLLSGDFAGELRVLLGASTGRTRSCRRRCLRHAGLLAFVTPELTPCATLRSPAIHGANAAGPHGCSRRSRISGRRRDRFGPGGRGLRGEDALGALQAGSLSGCLARAVRRRPPALGLTVLDAANAGLGIMRGTRKRPGKRGPVACDRRSRVRCSSWNGSGTAGRPPRLVPDRGRRRHHFGIGPDEL